MRKTDLMEAVGIIIDAPGAKKEILGEKEELTMLQKSRVNSNRRIMQFAIASILLMICRPMLAQSVGWFNGILDPNNLNGGIQNYAAPSGAWGVVFDDFDVPPGGWHVVGVFSDNLKISIFSGDISAARWEIRSGLADGTLGTVVASGTNSASWTLTGRSWGPEALPASFWLEYRLQVSGLNVTLPQGKYWLSVAPVLTQSWNPTSALSITAGSGAVGDPPGNNGNSFFVADTTSYPENLSTRLQALTDFSLGIYVELPPDPEVLTANLIATVTGMHIQIVTSLTDQLHAVLNDIISNNGLACQDLNAFTNHVNAQTGNKITGAQAAIILAQVAKISAAIPCH